VSKTLGEQLPNLMATVRDEILPQYLELGHAGRLGAQLIRVSLDEAAKALASGDLVAMITAYKNLKEIK
jgi:hypothetical protein